MITKNTTGLEKCSNGKIAPIGKFPFSKPKGRLRSGFTIVELLIVIVVIGIIAVIAIVAYNGIQKRAGTIAYTSAIDSLEKQIRISEVLEELPADPSELGVNGRLVTGSAMLAQVLGAASGLPTAPGFCIGTLEDYPATSKFAAGECYRMYVGDELEPMLSESTFVDNSLSQLFTDMGMSLPRNLPVVSYRSLLSTNFGLKEAQFESRDVSAIVTEESVLLLWVPPNRSSCGRGENAKDLALQMLSEAGMDDADGYIQLIKDTPGGVSSAIDELGPNWEDKFHEFWNSAYGPDSFESCYLQIER